MKSFPILRDDLDKKIGIAGHHVAFANLGPVFEKPGKMHQIGFRMIGQPNMDKNGKPVSKLVGRYIGVVTTDIAGLFQSAHTAQAGRGRDVGHFGEIDIGLAAILLEFAQDGQINPIEFDVLHAVLVCWGATDCWGDTSLMSSKSQVTCWVVSEGVVGMENQCLGLAAALGLDPVVKRIRLRSPWKQLAPFFRLGLRWAFSSKGDSLKPPFPDLIIASGRAGAMACLLARRSAKLNGGKRVFTVYIQNPVIDPSRFDLVALPRHDGLLGENVVSTRGSLHRVTPEKLATESELFKDTFAGLPRPWISVVIGGSSAVYRLTPVEMEPIVAQLTAVAKETGGSLIVTASRRTGAENMEILKKGLEGVPHYLWDNTGPNPYYAMLGSADYILVTADSANMNSEACSTGKPVYVIPLAGGSEKFRRFHQALRDDGLTRPFKGKLEKWTYTPLNDVELVANRVREMMGITR